MPVAPVTAASPKAFTISFETRTQNHLLISARFDVLGKRIIGPMSMFEITALCLNLYSANYTDKIYCKTSLLLSSFKMNNQSPSHSLYAYLFL